MAGIDPSVDEVNGFASLTVVLDWAGVPGTADDDKTMRGALLLSLGAEEAMPPRVVGAMTEGDFSAILDTIKLDGAQPTPVQRTTADLLGRACRVASGLEPRLVEVMQRQKKAEEDLQNLAMAKATAPPPPPPSSTAAASKGRLVKLSLVVSQTAEQEVSILEPDRLKAAYKRYHAVFKRAPPPNRELTAEQLSGLDALLSDASQPVPYVDFSIWGPHHHRLTKQIKLAGATFDSNGRLRQIEILGPPNFEAWEESYGCLETGFIMFDTVDLGNILNYCTKIGKYVKRYGAALWYLVYQGDHRMRLEGMERIRRRGESERQDAIEASGKHPFDPARPWNWVWEQAVLDQAFWKEEIEEPALLILSRTQSLSSMIGDDVHIDQAMKEHRDTATMVSPTSPAPIKRQGPSDNPTPRKQQKTRSHSVSNGKFTHNRSGVPLCNGFNAGTCNETSNGIKCNKNPSLVHQCNLCLSIDHNGSTCTKAAPPSSHKTFGPRGGDGGKGKGKGKGGNKGKNHF